MKRFEMGRAMGSNLVREMVDYLNADAVQDGHGRDVSEAKAALQRAAGEAPAGEKIRRILVAVDHRHHPALEAGVKLAEALGAKLCVLYVLEPTPVVDLEWMSDLPGSYEEVRSAALELLKKFEESDMAPPGTEAILREGRPAKEIIAAAKEFEADLIIMGAHRRGALTRFLLGSVAERVLKQSPCAVMFATDKEIADDPKRFLRKIKTAEGAGSRERSGGR